jgi:hypothetical protein
MSTPAYNLSTPCTQVDAGACCCDCMREYAKSTSDHKSTAAHDHSVLVQAMQRQGCQNQQDTTGKLHPPPTHTSCYPDLSCPRLPAGSPTRKRATLNTAQKRCWPKQPYCPQLGYISFTASYAAQPTCASRWHIPHYVPFNVICWQRA